MTSQPLGGSNEAQIAAAVVSGLGGASHSLEAIRKYLSADSLCYLSQAGMVKATGLPANAFCMACYDGQYPVAFDPATDKHIIERRNGQRASLARPGKLA